VRLVRVARPDGPDFGVLEGDVVRLLEGHPFGPLRPTDLVAPLEEVRLLAPVLPSKILAAGRNYAAHAAELGRSVPDEPLIFMKPATSVIGPGSDIRLPGLSREVHHEAELAIVIGALTRRVTPEAAVERILGYTCANDVTARDLQGRDEQWTRAKGFDTFCPLGPWIDTEIDPRDGLVVRCRVNGELRQEASSAGLVFGIGALVAHCAAFATLLPGDVILTGTPAGVGPLHAGDVCEVAVEGLGALTNPVSAEE
jgi:2-keto-4-pentenoate hydratase/2-oxohepta-3-ene-1,7-dioic acid hydratase in catechol pathway